MDTSILTVSQGACLGLVLMALNIVFTGTFKVWSNGESAPIGIVTSWVFVLGLNRILFASDPILRKGEES